MKRIIILSFIIMFSILFSCGNEPEAETPTNNDLVEVTGEQFLSENMQLGTVQQVLMEERISFTGKIVPDPQGIALINAPIEGFVRTINVRKGDYVSTNATIIEIGGNALIDLQQAFTASSARLRRFRADYERIKILYDDNISTEKEFVQAESDYKSELASYNGLRMKLQDIGLNISDIEKGNYVPVYSLKSPINGQVSMINCKQGQFLMPGNEIAEVADKGKVELRLDIFEKDYPKIASGKKVVFRSVDEMSQNISATITRVGNKIEAGSSAIECFASINPEDGVKFAINQLVSGEIIIEADSVPAIQQSALLTSGESKYILVKTGEGDGTITFRKVRVDDGRIFNDYVELLNLDIKDSIIISGTYNLN